MEIQSSTQIARSAQSASATQERERLDAPEPARVREDLAASAARDARAKPSASAERREARLDESAGRRAERDARAEALRSDAEIEIEPPGTLAARTGPAPVETPAERSADEMLRAGLEERARLVEIEGLIQIEDGADERAAATSDDAAELPELDLPGSGGDPDAAEMPPLFGDSRREGEERVDQTRAPRRPLPREDEPFARGREEPDASETARAEESAAAASLDDAPEQAHRAAAVAPQAAPLPVPPGGGAEPELRPGVADAPEERRIGESVARRSLTEAGLVEAEAGDAIVTRFIDGLPGRDPGPEPRPEQHLGERPRAR